jgi:predicted enzyme related to lactoylglutathione lyase
VYKCLWQYTKSSTQEVRHNGKAKVKQETHVMEMKLELVPVAVEDVDRAKDFYEQKLGFHVDIDQKVGEDIRFVQLTPPGSACSIAIGVGVTKARSGSLDGLLLVVEDINAVHDALAKRGVDITKPKLMPWGTVHADFSDPDGNRWTLQQPRKP